MPTRCEACQTLDVEGLNGMIVAYFAHLIKMLKCVRLTRIKSRIALESAEQTKVGLLCRLLPE